MLKNISALLNCVLILLVFLTLLDKGVPDPSDDEFLLVLLVIVTPIVTLLTYWRGFGSAISDTKGLVGLYFRRKVLEEKRKIEELSSHK